jgi:hypothetical protein
MNDTDLIFSSTDIFFFFFPRLVDFDSLQKALAFNFDGVISIDATRDKTKRTHVLSFLKVVELQKIRLPTRRCRINWKCSSKIKSNPNKIN